MREEWRLWLNNHRDMHSFTGRTTFRRCRWCGVVFADWLYWYLSGYDGKLCNCGENDLPKPERDIVL